MNKSIAAHGNVQSSVCKSTEHDAATPTATAPVPDHSDRTVKPRVQRARQAAYDLLDYAQDKFAHKRGYRNIDEYLDSRRG